MTQFGRDRNGVDGTNGTNGRHQDEGADLSAPSGPEGNGDAAGDEAPDDLDIGPSGSLEVQARMRTISEIYSSLFYSIDAWLLDGEEVIEIEHFFLTGDMKKHIRELARPFEVEFLFGDREGDAAAGDDEAEDG